MTGAGQSAPNEPVNRHQTVLGSNHVPSRPINALDEMPSEA
jgi:hypothetical protein